MTSTSMILNFGETPSIYCSCRFSGMSSPNLFSDSGNANPYIYIYTHIDWPLGAITRLCCRKDSRKDFVVKPKRPSNCEIPNFGNCIYSPARAISLEFPSRPCSLAPDFSCAHYRPWRNFGPRWPSRVCLYLP